MISLRVSEEEYENFKQLYSAHGARNLSDFARIAMQRVAGEHDSQEAMNLKLLELDGRLIALEARFARWLPKGL